jgi:hypothetical protein
MARPSPARLDGLLRRAHERIGDLRLPAPRDRAMAPRHTASGTEASVALDADETHRRALPTDTTHPTPLAGATLSRHASEVGARYGSTARRDLCGGTPVMAFPTATPPFPVRQCHMTDRLPSSRRLCDVRGPHRSRSGEVGVSGSRRRHPRQGDCDEASAPGCGAGVLRQSDTVRGWNGAGCARRWSPRRPR